ncbi:biopolymer transporter ExbD [Stappia sp.]|uniref:ExbD/TolR family protein n=1 Tax=Stappia sp. TaxID=1870903 RepID=UPI0032D93EDB
MRSPLLRRKPASDSTIPLINIVFLMLIFFLFAGSISRDDARDIVAPESIAEDEAVRATGALVIAEDGSLTHNGAVTDLDAYLLALAEARAAEDAPSPVRVAADRALPAARLKEVLARLGATGIGDVVLITQRAAP